MGCAELWDTLDATIVLGQHVIQPARRTLPSFSAPHPALSIHASHGINRPARPLQNRVTPLGEIVADPARGLVYGNRGCLHDAGGRIVRHHAGRRWIACRLAFRSRRRELLRPGRYTELFFLDEATALAAGHRPCAACRHADYDALLALWRELHPADAGADAIDARLHAERLDGGGRARRLHEADVGDLPDGAFVLCDGAPWLVLGAGLGRWA